MSSSAPFLPNCHEPLCLTNLRLSTWWSERAQPDKQYCASEWTAAGWQCFFHASINHAPKLTWTPITEYHSVKRSLSPGQCWIAPSSNRSLREESRDDLYSEGESSDTLTIDEWEESMRNFRRKMVLSRRIKLRIFSSTWEAEQKRLWRVGIRNSEIDVKNSLQAIYELLHKHFSYTCCYSVPISNYNSTMLREQKDTYGQLMRFRKCRMNTIWRMDTVHTLKEQSPCRCCCS